MAPNGVDLVRVMGTEVPSGVDIVRVILSVANKDDNDDDGVLLLDKTTSAEPSALMNRCTYPDPTVLLSLSSPDDDIIVSFVLPFISSTTYLSVNHWHLEPKPAERSIKTLKQSCGRVSRCD
jgi:hypothetical protein